MCLRNCKINIRSFTFMIYGTSLLYDLFNYFFFFFNNVFVSTFSYILVKYTNTTLICEIRFYLYQLTDLS